MVQLDPLFREFVELLNSKNVKFMVVGGYAVSHYGRPRFTGDIDIWLAVSEENGQKVIDSLIEFGLGSLNLTKEDFSKKDQVIQLGREPLRIDLLTGLSGVEFADCFTRVVYVDNDGLVIPFIHLKDLRINKLSTGRKIDFADLDRLPEIE